MTVTIYLIFAFTFITLDSHILVDSHEYSHIRQKFYALPDLKTLFERTDSSLILGFLKESKLYKSFRHDSRICLDFLVKREKIFSGNFHF